MHQLTSQEIHTYCELFSSPEPEALRELNRQTHIQTEQPIMLSGHLQGRFLSFLSHMLRPTYILEIGTFTGYSAICLAEGLQVDGKLFTIDIDEERAELAKEYFNKSNVQDKINLLLGKASDIIPSLQYQFDLVFIDADKTNYCQYFDLVIDKVRPGGIILADNVLYHGDVLLSNPGKNAKAMQAYNQKLAQDARVENILLPLRDGIMMTRKK
ncbi:MAG: O-methyltransferase [Chitinophagaceae bacterium]|nr:O-methyltransferase [Chitinophagaceae bacterium]